MCEVSSLIKHLHFKFNSLPAPPYATLFFLSSCLCVKRLVIPCSRSQSYRPELSNESFWRDGEVVCEWV